MLGKTYDGQDCSIAGALEVIGERWTLLIIRDAMYGVRRFSDFQAHLDIPKAVLSDRLRGLVENGVLDRMQDPDHTGRHVYELTAAGRDLWPVLHSLLVWGQCHGRPNSRIFVHSACDTELDAGARCPRCGLTPALSDIITVLRPGRAQRRDDPVAIVLRQPHRMLEPITTT